MVRETKRALARGEYRVYFLCFETALGNGVSSLSLSSLDLH